MTNNFLARLNRIFSRGQTRSATIAAALVVALGIGIRIYVYAAGRSLWFDEAVLALSFVRRSLGGLLQPLDYGQIAPLGFVLLVKAFMIPLGNSDYVLRIVPLLAGIATVPLIYLLGIRWSSGWAPLLALAMLALAPTLIYFSSEFKQYSSDALATLVVLLAGWACLLPEAGPRRFVILGISGSLALWISHPAVFVAGGVIIALAWSFLRSRDWRQLRRLIFVGLALAASLAIIYVITLRRAAGDPGLAAYWQPAFAPLSGPGIAGWYHEALGGLANPSAVSPGLLVFVVFVLGLVSFGVRNRYLLVMAGLPLLLALAASAMHLYPFSGRFLLFSAPIVFIVTAEGVERIRQVVLRWNVPLGNLVGLACAVALLAQPTRNAVEWLQSPPLRDHIKPALAYLSQHRQAGDTIYLYYMAIPQFDYYAPFYGLQQVTPIEGIASRGHPIAYVADLEALAGKPRVWLIFSHVYRSGKLDEQVYFAQHLDQIGTRLEEYYSPGATIYLYDLTKPPPG